MIQSKLKFKMAPGMIFQNITFLFVNSLTVWDGIGTTNLFASK